MSFAAALSVDTPASRAAEAVTAEVSSALEGQAPDLALVFVSPHHGSQIGAIARSVQAGTRARCVLGCTGESIIGVDREVEQRPAVAAWAAVLPGVQVVPFQIERQETAEGPTFAGWPDEFPPEVPAGSTLLLLGDPFSLPADDLLAIFNDEHPGVRVVGGMASGGFGPGTNRLVLDGRQFESGAVGALLLGPVRVQTVVSQGCRPIGRPMVITRGEGNVIEQIGGRPALEQLQAVYSELSPQDQELVRQGIHLGRVINEYQDAFAQGDFLVRNVMGAVPESGAIVITDLVRPGQTVQYHVRDAQTAAEDLRELLAHGRGRNVGGALVFSCNGRGSRLFGAPGHDVAAVRAQFGPIPVAGFFAQGEIGPVGGKNFMHGYTASIALFEQPFSKTS